MLPAATGDITLKGVGWTHDCKQINGRTNENAFRNTNALDYTLLTPLRYSMESGNLIAVKFVVPIDICV